jgi:hypothetical protein
LRLSLCLWLAWPTKEAALSCAKAAQNIKIFWPETRPFAGPRRSARKEKLLTEPKAAETNFLEGIMLGPTLASGQAIPQHKTSGGKR